MRPETKSLGKQSSQGPCGVMPARPFVFCCRNGKVLIATVGQEVVHRSARASGPTRIPSDSFHTRNATPSGSFCANEALAASRNVTTSFVWKRYRVVEF